MLPCSSLTDRVLDELSSLDIINNRRVDFKATGFRAKFHILDEAYLGVSILLVVLRIHVSYTSLLYFYILLPIDGEHIRRVLNNLL